jgi:glucokinase
MKNKGFIGVDIGGTNIKAALVIDGKIRRRIKLATRADLGPTTSIIQVKSAIEPFVKHASGIGIGIAGIIDSRNGVVRFSPNLKGWHNITLASILKNEFKKPVKILNDTNAICLGEWKYGVAQGYNNVFLFTLGTGVGGAAICEGKPLFGANGFAGEFGHTVIKYNGPKCTCEKFGHLEGYVGARFIVGRAKKKIKGKKSSLKKYKNLTPEIIADEAKKGDRIAREIFSEIGFYIGIGVSNIIALFDPDVVVVAGGISRAGRILFNPIRETLTQRVFGVQHRTYKIVPAKLGDDAGILGAVSFASGIITI